MSDSDDPQRGALERALYSIIQDILGNSSSGISTGAEALAASALPDPATAAAVAAAASAGVGEVTLGKPQSLFRWLKDAKKQIAPHADKVPLPIVQGLAKTVFPPAGAVVPVIRYLQTPASGKHAKRSGALQVGLAPAAPPPQVYIIPVVQPPPTPDKQVVFVRGAVRDVVGAVRRHPVLSVLALYIGYRMRGVPGKMVRSVDRVLNALFAMVWGLLERKTRASRAWAARKTREARMMIASVFPSHRSALETVQTAEPVPEGGQVQLDIGDAAWVVIMAIVALYVGYNRKNIWGRN